MIRSRSMSFRRDLPQHHGISWFLGATIYKLEENYRSTQPILSLANTLFRRHRRSIRSLFVHPQTGRAVAGSGRGGGENAQSRFVAQKILELVEEGSADEIAILVRSSFHHLDLESSCRVWGCCRYGDKFIEAAHVKDLAHLRVVVNPQTP